MPTSHRSDDGRSLTQSACKGTEDTILRQGLECVQKWRKRTYGGPSH